MTIEIIQTSAAVNIVALQATFPNLSPEQLFDAWTKPELITKWWPPVAHFRYSLDSIEPMVGGDYIFEWPAIERVLQGTFLAWQRPNLLVFTWQWEHEPELDARTVTLRITQNAANQTVLRLTQGVYNYDFDRDQKDIQDHIDGWNFFLPRLADAMSSS